MDFSVTKKNKKKARKIRIHKEKKWIIPRFVTTILYIVSIVSFCVGIFGISNDDYKKLELQPTSILLPGKSHGRRSLVGCSPWGFKELDTTERLLFHFHALEKAMATHSSVLAWRIPGTTEPGGLPSMGSHRVRHD